MVTKRKKQFTYELAASILLAALFTNDEEACAKYGITTRTLRRYRQKQAEDPKLNDLVAAKKRLFDSQWAETLPGAMREAVEAIGEIAKAIRADPAARRNPFSLEKLGGALKMCAEVWFTGQYLESRMAARNSGQTTSGEKVLPFSKTG